MVRFLLRQSILLWPGRDVGGRPRGQRARLTLASTPQPSAAITPTPRRRLIVKTPAEHENKAQMLC